MINLIEAVHEQNKLLVEDVIERSDQFVEGVIERMEERLRCSAELDRIDDADTYNPKERKKLS
jgi:Zn-dependent M32 family carboxypeptidase